MQKFYETAILVLYIIFGWNPLGLLTNILIWVYLPNWVGIVESILGTAISVLFLETMGQFDKKNKVEEIIDPDPDDDVFIVDPPESSMTEEIQPVVVEKVEPAKPFEFLMLDD